MDLAAFLLARIAEDEAVARRAGTAKSWEYDGSYEVGKPYDSVCESGNADDLWHIARWDPARVLAECEAKRRIVALHQPSDWRSFHHGGSTGSVAAWAKVPDDEDLEADAACKTCGEFSEYAVPWPCETLLALASVYADHPDYAGLSATT